MLKKNYAVFVLTHASKRGADLGEKERCCSGEERRDFSVGFSFVQNIKFVNRFMFLARDLPGTCDLCFSVSW